MAMRSFLEDRVERRLTKPLLHCEGEVVSYEEFDRRVNRAARGFWELGVRKGDKVSLLLPNVPEFLYAWFGLAKIGSVMVPVNTGFKPSEASYVVRHSDSVGMVVSGDHLTAAQSIREECPAVQWVVCTEGGEGALDYGRLCREMPEGAPAVDVADDDLVQIIYTSGTTGFPKGVMHVHRDMAMTGEAFTLCAGLSSDDRVMVILPLFHANAQYYSVMGALAAEASLVLIRRFSAGAFWEQTVQYGVTEFNFVGAVGRILCRRPLEEFRSDHRIRTAYGALVTPDVYEHFTKRFGIANVIDGYGLTEVPRVSQNPIGGTIKMRSMGLPARHPDPAVKFAEVKIVDEDSREVPPGEKGELIIRSPVMMKGYYKDEEKTREAIRNDWFYSGDYAYRDTDGYLFFVDRKKDIIRRKGENISATEIESAINGSDKVLEAAVIAVPSELGEDEILASVVLKTGAKMTPEEVIDQCQERLASFKIPRYVQFRESLPKTSTERTAKFILKAEERLIALSHDMAGYKQKLHL
ncbi:MAG: AMP-binding protein [Deltaproteobacteria bacterium]|nr:AMP-binding protein [Deltaproteobacteria bacterium]